MQVQAKAHPAAAPGATAPARFAPRLCPGAAKHAEQSSFVPPLVGGRPDPVYQFLQDEASAVEAARAAAERRSKAARARELAEVRAAKLLEKKKIHGLKGRAGAWVPGARYLTGGLLVPSAPGLASDEEEVSSSDEDEPETFL